MSKEINRVQRKTSTMQPERKQELITQLKNIYNEFVATQEECVIAFVDQSDKNIDMLVFSSKAFALQVNITLLDI